MGTKLYVGNLSFNTTETDLQDLFAQAGAVQDVMLMQDKFTGKSRGFAFVTMATEQEAQNAITQFNGKTVEGRALTVNEARPREARPQGGGGGGVMVAAVVAAVAAMVAVAVAAAVMAAAIADPANPNLYSVEKRPLSQVGRFLLIPFREAAVRCR